MCDKGQKWDMMTLQCVPDTSAATSGSGSDDNDNGAPVLSSILGNLPGILTGAGNFLSAARGNPASVNNFYGDQKTGVGISLVPIVIVIALILVLFFVFTKSSKK